MGKNDTKYVQSKEQKDMYATMKPWMDKLFSGESPYDVGQAPTYGGYDIPDTKSMMPTGDWWSSLDPSIKAGIEQPYKEGANQLGEQLGSYGEASQMGGASGSMAAGLGSYWADATPQMATQGWNMVSPALQAGWQAQLGQNQSVAETNYSGDLAEWNAELNKKQLPYSVMAGMYGGTYSTPVVSQPWYSSLLGGAGAAGTAYGLGKIGG